MDRKHRARLTRAALKVRESAGAMMEQATAGGAERSSEAGAGPGGRGGAEQGGQAVGRDGASVGRRVERLRSSVNCKRRTPVSLGNQLELISLKKNGHSWTKTLASFPLDISPSAAGGIYKKRVEYKRRAATAEDPSSFRWRRSYFEQISKGL